MTQRTFNKDKLYTFFFKAGKTISIVFIIVFVIALYMNIFQVDSIYKNYSDSCLNAALGLQDPKLIVDAQFNCIRSAKEPVDLWFNLLWVSGLIGFGLPIGYILSRKFYNYIFPVQEK